jgi:hypothetical protein
VYVLTESAQVGILKTYSVLLDTLYHAETLMAGQTPLLNRISPTLYLRFEGAALLAAAATIYAQLPGGTGWPWFAVGFFLPDVAMLGYLAGPARGALAYNLAHTTVFPVVLLFAAWAMNVPAAASAALIWLAHIGFDRLAGYGLKWPTAFGDTHLGRFGGGRASGDR